MTTQEKALRDLRIVRTVTMNSTLFLDVKELHRQRKTFSKLVSELLAEWLKRQED